MAAGGAQATMARHHANHAHRNVSGRNRHQARAVDDQLAGAASGVALSAGARADRRGHRRRRRSNRHRALERRDRVDRAIDRRARAVAGRDWLRSVQRRRDRPADGPGLRHNWFAKSALEMACWDIRGKAENKPVYELLGGACRPLAVRSRYSMGAYEPERAAQARARTGGRRLHHHQGQSRHRRRPGRRARAGRAQPRSAPTSRSPSMPTAAGTSTRPSAA